MFRVTLFICTLFAILYSGYWVVGWVALTKGAETWADDRRAEGWQVEWSDLSVQGFPSRFDTTLTEPLLTDPETGWSWQAPFFQLLALSYKPHHLIAVWPNTHSLATPYQRYAIAHDSAKASLVFSNGTDLRIDRATLVVDALKVATSGSQFSTGTLNFAIRPTGEAPLSYDIGMTVRNLALASDLKRQLDPAGILPAAVDTLSLNAALGFDAPWDRFALETRRPQPTSLQIASAKASWGGLDLRIAADLTFDAAGLANGDITVKATNWREIVALSHNAGLLPTAFLPMVENALGSMAGLSGPANTLDIPLKLRQGTLSLGLIPLGSLPPFRLR